MGATYIHEGAVIDYTPSTNIAAGDVVVIGEMVGVALTNIPANTPGSLAVSGVFDFPKATGSGTSISQGISTFWDPVNKVATPESLDNYLIGKCVKSATNNDAIVRVRMSQ